MIEPFDNYESIKKVFEKHQLSQDMYKSNVSMNDKKNTLMYYPDKIDNLFWCVFIHKYSLDEYLQIGCKYKNRELEEKSSIVEYMKQKNNPSIKLMKIAKTDIQTMIGDLMTNEKTTLFSLQSLSLYFQLHIYLVCQSNRTYIEYNNLATDVCIIYKKSSLSNEKNTKYWVDLQVSSIMVEVIKEQFVKYDTYDRILKNVSSYKKKELDIIVTKLGLVHNLIKPSKNEIFSLIATI